MNYYRYELLPPQSESTVSAKLYIFIYKKKSKTISINLNPWTELHWKWSGFLSAQSPFEARKYSFPLGFANVNETTTHSIV